MRKMETDSPSQMSSAPTAAEVANADSILEALAPGYLDQVRGSAGKLGVKGAGPDLVRDTLSDVEELIHLDVDVPTYATQRAGKAIKTVVKRSIEWYIRYIAAQINAIGEAMVGFGSAVADRLDELESSKRVLEEKVSELSRKVDSLEAGTERNPG